MKKFQFKFHAVQKVRKIKEDEALRALAEAQRHQQNAAERKKTLISQLQTALQRKEELGSESTPISVFHLEDHFIIGTKQKIIQADHLVSRAIRGVEKALYVYLQARRQSRVMEILYDRAYTEYRREKAKQEQKQFDELYVMRAEIKEDNP